MVNGYTMPDPSSARGAGSDRDCCRVPGDGPSLMRAQGSTWRKAGSDGLEVLFC